jgi:hypothetical protein
MTTNLLVDDTITGLFNPDGSVVALGAVDAVGDTSHVPSR